MNHPYFEQALDLLRRFYGYPAFRPSQEPVIRSLLNGEDTVAIMPTGAGKSICFQIPAMIFPGITLVISPLISLMKDQVDALTGQGIPASYINSTLSAAESEARLNDIAAGRYKLVYVAPERLDTDYFNTSSNTSPFRWSPSTKRIVSPNGVMISDRAIARSPPSSPDCRTALSSAHSRPRLRPKSGQTSSACSPCKIRRYT